MGYLATININNHPLCPNIKRKASVIRMELDFDEIQLEILVEHFEDNNGDYGEKINSVTLGIQDIAFKTSTNDSYIDLKTNNLVRIKNVDEFGISIFEEGVIPISEIEFWKNIPTSSFNLDSNSTIFYHIIQPLFFEALNKLNNLHIFQQIY